MKEVIDMTKHILRYHTDVFTLVHSVTAQPTNVDTHIHDCYEIVYLQSGNLTYYIEGQAYHMQSGDMIVTNSRELHRFVFNSPLRYERKYIQFKPEYISTFQSDDYNLLHYLENRKLGSFNKISSKDVQSYQLDDLWEQLSYYAKNATPENKLMLKSIFIQMLIMINKILAKSNHTKADKHTYDQKINDILQYINQHVGEKITLDALEQKFFVNKYYLCHMFKKNTGFTVFQYITYKRIMKALELLISGMNALDVAHAVGYSDYSTFYKAFKNIMGRSPKQYSRK